MKPKFWLLSALLVLGSYGATVRAQPPAQPSQSVEGLYKTILQHKDSKFYQTAAITLRTTNPTGTEMKISANVRMFFGDFDSKEFLTYEFDDCKFNPLTRVLTIKNDKNDISLIGTLRSGTMEGEWFATVVGKAGTFVSTKDAAPRPPQDGIVVKTLTGHYRGPLTDATGDLKATERLALALVTTQDTSGTGNTVKISGSVRLYMGEFGSIEYWEYKLAEVNFNFYNRYLTAKTVSDPELTFRGTVSQDGIFSGVVFGSPGEGKVELKQIGPSALNSRGAARPGIFRQLWDAFDRLYQ